MRSTGEVAKAVALNFIKAHGRDKFLKLIEMFHNHESGPKIAFEFKVSRQRVHQWKYQLGHERIIFIPHPEIEALIGTANTRKVV
jgi:hypothetical protein